MKTPIQQMLEQLDRYEPQKRKPILLALHNKALAIEEIQNDFFQLLDLFRSSKGLGRTVANYERMVDLSAKIGALRMVIEGQQRYEANNAGEQ